MSATKSIKTRGVRDRAQQGMCMYEEILRANKNMSERQYGQLLRQEAARRGLCRDKRNKGMYPNWCVRKT